MHSGQTIRRARRRSGLTQSDLAGRLHTTQSAVARWERGLVSPRVESLQRILNACGFELRLSLARSEEPDLDQIRERLAWTPRQRLDYLVDMVAFENRARRAKRIPSR